MKRALLSVLVVMTLAGRSRANQAPAPHAGLLARTAAGIVAFTLEHTSVDVDIAGVMSRVKVKQTFKNPIPTPIEAVYVFPLPARAAVHAMTLRVGERRITAEVQRRGEAKRTYEAAREAGKTAALLEEERDDVFTQSVANVLPGDAIEIELSYTQELVPVDGEYELVFPMVVAPRYSPPSVHDAARIEAPVLAPSDRPGNDIAIHVWMEAGVPIEHLRSPTHEIELRTPRPGTAVVDLRSGDRIPNRDFTLRWRLTGERPRASVLAGKDVHGGHVLIMVQPQADLRAADVAAREYVFVVDVSGSMMGEPHARAQHAMDLLLHDLRPSDRLQVILFESGVRTCWSSSQPATTGNIKRALAFVDTTEAGGGTEVLPALRAAVEAPRTPGLAREVAIITDGEIGNEDDILRYLRAHRRGLDVFSVGVGSSVNRGFIDALARVGHGEPFVMLPADNATQITQKLFKLMSRPALTDLSIDWGGLPVHDVVPAQPPNVFADRPLVMAAKLDRPASGTITLRGRLGGKPYEERVPVAIPAEDRGEALAYLWARRRITELGDERPVDERDMKKLEAQIAELGLGYHLVTAYTSFVAVDERVRTTGKTTRVRQPVALPPDVAAPPEAYVSPRGHFSSYSVRGGDPEVTIDAAPDVRGVTVILPDGQLLRCARRGGHWVASFLLPVDLPEGVHLVSVVLERGDGQVQLRRMRIAIDEHPPELELVLSARRVRPGEEVSLTARTVGGGAPLLPLDEDIGDRDVAARIVTDADDVYAVIPDERDAEHGHVLRLGAGPARSFSARFTAPRTPGRYRIAVLARDGARNGGRAVIELEVTP